MTLVHVEKDSCLLLQFIRKASLAANPRQLKPKAGKESGSSSPSTSTELLCSVAEAQRHGCTVKALVCPAMDEPGAAGASIRASPCSV